MCVRLTSVIILKCFTNITHHTPAVPPAVSWRKYFFFFLCFDKYSIYLNYNICMNSIWQQFKKRNTHTFITVKTINYVETPKQPAHTIISDLTFHFSTYIYTRYHYLSTYK